MTPDGRNLSGSVISPKSGPGRPHTHISQPAHLNSSQMPPTHCPSAQMPPTQVPPPYPQLPPPASATNIPPSGATNAMFRVQMWSNNFDSGVHSMNHSSVSSIRASIIVIKNSLKKYCRLSLTEATVSRVKVFVQ